MTDVLPKDEIQYFDLLKMHLSRMELHAAEQTDTLTDNPGIGMNPDGQLDCVDEASNTTAFLLLLKEKGLHPWQVVGPVAKTRGGMFWQPHYGAVIADRYNRWTVLDSGISKPGGKFWSGRWDEFYR